MSLTGSEQSNAVDGNDYRLFVRRKIQRALWLILPGAVVLLIAGYKPEARGLALGGLFSVLNFYVLARVVGERLNRPGVKGRLFGVAWYVIRLVLLAGPLYLAAVSDYVALVTTAAGLFAIQISLLLEPLFARMGRA